MTQFKFAPIAAIALAAAIGSAQAADVQIYGLIDTGLNFTSVDKDVAGSDDETTFQQKGSQMIPSRWGFKGSEELANGMKVGFMLEGQMGTDDGSMTGGRLFHRAAQVQLSGSYGTFVMGRSGMLRSGFGSTGIWAVKVSPFSNAWGNFMAGSKYVMPGDFKSADNTFTYVSPAVAGFQFHAQYSSKLDSVTESVKGNEEFNGESDRMWALGATYTNGPVHAVAVLDSILYGNSESAGNYRGQLDDSLAFSLGGSYDFGVVKLYASGMYFDGMIGSKFQGHDMFNSIKKTTADGCPVTYKGYSLQVSTDIPLAGGTLKTNIGWMDAQADQVFDNTEVGDTDRITAAVAYVYPLSKRTQIYTGAGWVKDSSNVNVGSDPSGYEVLAGMMHRF